ncbi:HNH endonuclease signature motif containing protein [Yinghuangia sp. ASG 101]|uniref:HNH endonuclease signature motif containing protein n=1 Tax=Yinghuangia sp. ASG 101 TaxID=2896848 RepID=UPI0022B23B6F|nr:HNH endonuclease signature motif containing protein [Yinghuangia sp. ASG 101]
MRIGTPRLTHTCGSAAETSATGQRLRRALAEIGREYKCTTCGIRGTWNGQPITLAVDHINGDWRDHRAENLRYLCPNCHSQTDTYRGHARKAATSPVENQRDGS